MLNEKAWAFLNLWHDGLPGWMPTDEVINRRHTSHVQMSAVQKAPTYKSNNKQIISNYLASSRPAVTQSGTPQIEWSYPTVVIINVYFCCKVRHFNMRWNRDWLARVKWTFEEVAFWASALFFSLQLTLHSSWTTISLKKYLCFYFYQISYVISVV